VEARIRGVIIGPVRFTENKQLACEVSLAPWVKPIVETLCIGIMAQAERGLISPEDALAVAQDMVKAMLRIG
jgi:hypothetical protein